MFPNEAVFICRKCSAEISFHEEIFEKCRETRKIGCFNCDNKTDRRPGDVELFFRFYPRLIEAIQAFKNNGFELISYTVKEFIMNYYEIDKLTFKCNTCKNTFDISFNKIRSKLTKEPGIFRCPKCKINPELLKHTKEFFVSLKNVHDSFVQNTKFQWHIFQPLGLSVKDLGIFQR